MDKYLSKEAMLIQTAEEASELAQACLKLARKLRGENPTTKTEQECICDLNEEIADVMVCMDSLIEDFNIVSEESIESVIMVKTDRMIKRLEEKGDK